MKSIFTCTCIKNTITLCSADQVKGIKTSGVTLCTYNYICVCIITIFCNYTHTLLAHKYTRTYIHTPGYLYVCICSQELPLQATYNYRAREICTCRIMLLRFCKSEYMESIGSGSESVHIPIIWEPLTNILHGHTEYTTIYNHDLCIANSMCK